MKRPPVNPVQFARGATIDPVDSNLKMARPKVLIICAEPFNQERGSGITLSNLFAGWDSQRLLTLYWLNMKPDNAVCARQTKLAPLLGFRGWLSGGPAASATSDHPASRAVMPPTSAVQLFRSRLTSALRCVDRRLGFSGLLYWVHLSSETLREIEAFEPDLIYCPLGSRQAVSLLARVQSLLRLPLVVHVFDDWISLRPENLLGKLLFPQVRRRFLGLLRNAQARLVIGSRMAASYESRYGLPFAALQNPVDPALWTLPPRPVPSIPSALVLRFTGNLYQPGNLTALVEFAEAFEVTSLAGHELRFEIYAPSEIVGLYAPKFARCRRTTLQPVPAETASMVKLYAESDGLVIALDADLERGSLLTLSMPTKVPSILMSGRPLFIYAPRNAAVASFARTHAAGCVVEAPATRDQLAARIGEFLLNQEKRRAWASAGRQVALEQFTTSRVRPAFADLLSRAAAVRGDAANDRYAA